MLCKLLSDKTLQLSFIVTQQTDPESTLGSARCDCICIDKTKRNLIECNLTMEFPVSLQWAYCGSLLTVLVLNHVHY